MIKLAKSRNFLPTKVSTNKVDNIDVPDCWQPFLSSTNPPLQTQVPVTSQYSFSEHVTPAHGSPEIEFLILLAGVYH